MSGSLYEYQLACQFHIARIANCDPNESDPNSYALY
jgi:hypothetical protein